VLEDHNFLTRLCRRVEYAPEPAKLLDRKTNRPSLLRVQPNESKAAERHCPTGVINILAEFAGFRIALRIVIAYQGVPRHFEPGGQAVEKKEFIVGAILNVIADELNEIGPDQIVSLFDAPKSRFMMLQIWPRKMKVAWNHDSHGISLFFHDVTLFFSRG
jgi:hypothetical protein